MAKKSNTYYCTACGYESSGWLGKCPNCGGWNTFEEKPRDVKPKKVEQAGVSTGWLQDLLDEAAVEIELDNEDESSDTSEASPKLRSNSGTNSRHQKLIQMQKVDSSKSEYYSSGISEFDRVLGGGFVPGSLVLVGGDPGIGKSTLLLQAASKSGIKSESILYICGEESAAQVKNRAERLGVDKSNINLSSEIVFENIAAIVQELKPKLCIIDSIQTVYSEQSSSAPGSVSQVRDCSAGFLRIAKSLGTTIILVGHVTKDGNIAGPRILEHMVDTVIYFEGDKYSNLRLVRAVKNRFGATNEVGIFDMTGQGLIPLEDTSSSLLQGRPINVAGSALTCVIEGTRPMIMEIQALLNPSSYASPIRVTQGFDRNRVSMLIALLEKKLNLGISNMDAFINVVNGFKADDPSTDLALIAGIVSSFKEKAIKDKLLLVGEVGLTGEVRPVSHIENRVKEANKLGFKYMIVPGANQKQVKKLSDLEMEIIYVDSIGEAMDVIW